MSQLSYTDQVLGFAGSLADNSLRNVVSRLNEESAAVGYGLGVARGSASDTFKNIAAVGDEFLGVLLHTFAVDNASETAQSCPADGAGSIAKPCRVLVTAETAVVDGDDAYVRIANGVADATQVTKGGWGGDDDSATRRHVKGAKFRSTAAKGAVAVLELAADAGEFDSDLNVYQIAAALSATTTINLGAAPVGRHMVIDSVQVSGGVPVGDATNHWVLELKAGATVVASWDSDTAVDGAIVQGTPTALNMGVAANRAVDPGEALTLVITKNGTITDVTTGDVVVHGRVA